MNNSALSKEDMENLRPKLKVIEHIGIVLGWHQYTATYVGEPDNLRPMVKSATIKNLAFGWWSPMSIFINPVVTTTNWVRFNSYSKEYIIFKQNPSEYLYEKKRKSLEDAEKTDRRFKYALIVLGALIAVGVVGSLMS